jgi:anti-sigma factor RsiW
MNCERCGKIMSEYIDGRLSVEESAALAAHLEECESCRTLERELRRTVALVGGLDRLDAPPGFAEELSGALERSILLGEGLPPKRRRILPWGIGGAALAAAAAILVVCYVNVIEETGPSIVAQRYNGIDGPAPAPAAGSEDPSIETAKETEPETDADARAARRDIANVARPGDIPDAERSATTPAEKAIAAVGLSEKEKIAVAENDSTGTLDAGVPKKESVTAPSRALEAPGEGGAIKWDAAGASLDSITAATDEDKTEEVAAHVAGRSATTPAETGIREAKAEQAKPPQIEFYSTEGAIQASAFFANSQLAPANQLDVAKAEPDDVKKALEALNVEVLEMSDDRAVLQADMKPAVVLYNNDQIAQNVGMSQSLPTPPEITSQIAPKGYNFSMRAASHSLKDGERPMTVQYVFIRGVPPKEAPTPEPPSDAPPAESPAASSAPSSAEPAPRSDPSSGKPEDAK